MKHFFCVVAAAVLVIGSDVASDKSCASKKMFVLHSTNVQESTHIILQIETTNEPPTKLC